MPVWFCFLSLLLIPIYADPVFCLYLFLCLTIVSLAPLCVALSDPSFLHSLTHLLPHTHTLMEHHTCMIRRQMVHVLDITVMGFSHFVQKQVCWCPQNSWEVNIICNTARLKFLLKCSGKKCYPNVLLDVFIDSVAVMQYVAVMIWENVCVYVFVWVRVLHPLI